MNRRGSILIIFLFVSVAFFMFWMFVLNVGRALNAREALQSKGDALLLSSLRLRVDGLEHLADRWSDVGAHILEGSPAGVLVHHDEWDGIVHEAAAVGSAIPGYKGRIKAVMTVARQANGLADTACEVIGDAGLQLGVSAQAVAMFDEAGGSQPLLSGWLRREWEEPWTARLRCSERLPLLFFGGQWLLQTESAGQVIWDVDLDNEMVALHGNGGFPRSWAAALDGGRVDPFRYPLFRAELAP